jgi:hypothetical protein
MLKTSAFLKKRYVYLNKKKENLNILVVLSLVLIYIKANLV